jgi:hypothetical protein
MALPKIEDVVKDPDFLALPESEKHKVFSTIDPDFAKLPQEEQVKVLGHFSGKPLPPIEMQDNSLSGRLMRGAKAVGKGLYENAPEIAGNTLGSIAAAPLAAPVALVSPAAGLAIESAGAGLGQGIGSLAKSAVQGGANLVQQIRGKEPAFPDTPATTGEILKTAGKETLKGAATPVAGKALGALWKGAKFAGKGAAALATGNTVKDVEALAEKAPGFLKAAPGKAEVEAAYGDANKAMGVKPLDKMQVAENASGPAGDRASEAIANPIISAVRAKVPVETQDLIAARNALDSLIPASHDNLTRSAYSEARTQINALLDKQASAYRAADGMNTDKVLADKFRKILPEDVATVSNMKSALGKLLLSNSIPMAGAAGRGIEAATSNPTVNTTLRAALGKLLTKSQPNQK